MRAVAFLAIIGLIFNLALHIASFVCVDPTEHIHPAWAFNVGFYAFFGAVVLLGYLVQRRREKLAKLEGRVLPTENPLWFKPVTWIIIGYMLFNFFVFGLKADSRGDLIRKPDGTFAADPGHGNPVVPISEAEYHRLRRLGVRSGSGFFLGFYAMMVSDAILTLTGQKRFKQTDPAMRSFSLTLIRWRRFGGD
jgi:hypothetical protein